MSVLVEKVIVHRDARGAVFEPLDAAAIRVQRNVHVVLTAPGAIRANHYHAYGTEVMTVQGPALVRYREDGAIAETIVADGQALRFTFPAGVSHAVQNTGNRMSVLIAFNSEAHDREAPALTDVLIAPQP
jgi:dTDP-4-dehydrorhamnose 3,5-epimerase-like enzyme